VCLRYRTCNAHAPCRHLWPSWIYHIFPYCLVNDMIFVGGGLLLNVQCMFWFSIQLLSETFLIVRVRRIKRYTLINIQRISCQVSVSPVRFSKTAQISSFTKIRPVGAEFRAKAQTDVTKLNCRFSQFCEHFVLFYCVFVWYRLCIFILIFTTATE
jgi:hypothetical protein